LINALNRKFFKEIEKGQEKGDKFLINIFTKKGHKRKEIFTSLKKMFENYADYSYNYVLADESDFERQVKEADVIYIHGGDTPTLLTTMKKFPNFKKLIIGKTVTGSSAGAYVLSEYYYTNSLDIVVKGLGILPVRTRCHYKGEDKKIDEKFAEFPESLKYELVLLKDCEYKVIYK